MANNQARIDDVVFDAVGDQVTVAVTEGEGALPLSPSGVSQNYASRADLVAAIQQAEEQFKQILPLLLLANAYKADATIKTTFKNNAKGRIAIADLTGTSAVFRIV